MSMSINAYLKDINLHLSEDMEPHLKPKFLPKLYLRFQIIDNEKPQVKRGIIKKPILIDT